MLLVVWCFGASLLASLSLSFSLTSPQMRFEFKHLSKHQVYGASPKAPHKQLMCYVWTLARMKHGFDSSAGPPFHIRPKGMIRNIA